MRKVVRSTNLIGILFAVWAECYSRAHIHQDRCDEDAEEPLSFLRDYSALGTQLIPEMQRVPEVLQLPVIIEGARPPSLEPQPSQEFDLVSGGIPAERSILKEFSEPRLVCSRMMGFSFDELEFLRLPRDKSVV
jgi:hypothetical protein